MKIGEHWGPVMRSFKSLTEREILALAISLEEEDARIYENFAEGLKDSHPAQAEQFRKMRAEEDGHRHRLLDHYRQKFGDYIPLIRRQDVKGFVQRRPVWLVRPLGLDAVRKQAEMMEVETRRFYESAARRRPTPACVSCSATSPRRNANTNASPRRWKRRRPHLRTRKRRRPGGGCS